jgi:trans-2,3-dihydro-3-hydroxyanthranilate isomerase
MNYSIVDVFAEAPFGGNPLAVVRDAAHLDTATMQAIALEMNLSETTFVTAVTGDRATVRIFTPYEELPFAGHPTLGTAWVLSGGKRPFTLALRAGDVPVRFANGCAWMTPPAARLGGAVSARIAAESIGLAETDLDGSIGPCYVTCGPKFLLIRVKTLAALKRVRVEREALNALEPGVYPFTVCNETYSPDADFAARMHFFDGAGMREDPATGSACAAFAASLKSYGATGSFVVEQGFEIARPARIYLRVGATNEVGGKVRSVAEGRFLEATWRPRHVPRTLRGDADDRLLAESHDE